ncbi:MAG: hypothetical protein IT290_06790 [Deltaproteobacteria bacterium]|nr:hypothetical protein [Deltaproteobacteria bacterium]
MVMPNQTTRNTTQDEVSPVNLKAVLPAASHYGEEQQQPARPPRISGSGTKPAAPAPSNPAPSGGTRQAPPAGGQAGQAAGTTPNPAPAAARDIVLPPVASFDDYKINSLIRDQERANPNPYYRMLSGALGDAAIQEARRGFSPDAPPAAEPAAPAPGYRGRTGYGPGSQPRVLAPDGRQIQRSTASPSDVRAMSNAINESRSTFEKTLSQLQGEGTILPGEMTDRFKEALQKSGINYYPRNGDREGLRNYPKLSADQVAELGYAFSNADALARTEYQSLKLDTANTTVGAQNRSATVTSRVTELLRNPGTMDNNIPKQTGSEPVPQAAAESTSPAQQAAKAPVQAPPRPPFGPGDVGARVGQDVRPRDRMQDAVGLTASGIDLNSPDAVRDAAFQLEHWRRFSKDHYFKSLYREEAALVATAGRGVDPGRFTQDYVIGTTGNVDPKGAFAESARRNGLVIGQSTIVDAFEKLTPLTRDQAQMLAATLEGLGAPRIVAEVNGRDELTPTLRRYAAAWIQSGEKSEGDADKDANRILKSKNPGEQLARVAAEAYDDVSDAQVDAVKDSAVYAQNANDGGLRSGPMVRLPTRGFTFGGPLARVTFVANGKRLFW